VRIALIGVQALTRDGLRASLREAGYDVVHEGDSLAALVNTGVDCDVVVLDLDHGDGAMTSQRELDALATRGCRVLVVSTLGRPDEAKELLAGGVAGFVPKWQTMQALEQAIRDVAAGSLMTSRDLARILDRDGDPGRPELSTQEATALRLYASGMKLSAVARQMNVQPSTAKEYIQRVREKYAAAGRPAPTKTDLYRQAVRDHILEE
jgi:DNA-binding NarL/FixJ family response regulator